MNVDLPSCIAGSKRAWDDFVRAAAPVIYAAVRRSLRSRGQAQEQTDDRVQEVYMRLLRDDCRLLRTFDPARASLSTWLTLISRTVVHEHTRRKRLPTVAMDGLANMSRPRDRDADAAATSDEALDELGELPIAMLSDQQRQVIEMLFHEGVSVEQAAARLGVEAQTVRSAKHKALTRLREHLGLVMNRPKTAGEKGGRGYRQPPAPIAKEKNQP